MSNYEYKELTRIFFCPTNKFFYKNTVKYECYNSMLFNVKKSKSKYALNLFLTIWKKKILATLKQDWQIGKGWPSWQKVWPSWQSWPLWQKVWPLWQKVWPLWQKGWPLWQKVDLYDET